MRVAVIGGGPAGLGAGWKLAQAGARVTLIEASPHLGGLARTIQLWEMGVELGPHLLVLAEPRVKALWKEVIGTRYESISRRTQVLTERGSFRYPFEPINAAMVLGPVESAKMLLGAIRRRTIPSKLGADGDLRSWTGSNSGQDRSGPCSRRLSRSC